MSHLPIFSFACFNCKGRYVAEQPPLTISIPVDDSVRGGTFVGGSKGDEVPFVETASLSPSEPIRVSYDETFPITTEILLVPKEPEPEPEPEPVYPVDMTVQEETITSDADADESVSEDPALLEPTPEAPYGYTATGRIRKKPLKSQL